MPRKLGSIFLIFLLLPLIIAAQQPKKLGASEIYQALKKLNFLGSVMYVAAHPDDENTRLISYLANSVNARTRYLSITRGDGGQNLIGPEIRELLGVIRTQELLSARNIDGGEQRFTRANDFGYSKHPDETLAIWNKNEVLGDVVLAIREFQPDIIINRFDHRSPGSTHGHHTSSALLSVEAFDISNDKTRFSEQLTITAPWQPKRLFFNTSWWFYGSEEALEKADKSHMLALDTGVFFPSSGLSNPEIAALSRSQHKSQGFGNTGSRGAQPEYLEFIKGQQPTSNNLFEGINTTWSRLEGGSSIGQLLAEVEANFNFTNPSASIPKLMSAYELISRLKDSPWKTVKTKEIKAIIAACAGLYLEATAKSNHATNNDKVPIVLELINRSDSPIALTKLVISGNSNASSTKPFLLKNNKKEILHDTLVISKHQKPTSPYWLTQKGSLGMFKVADIDLIGKPETPRAYSATFHLTINNIPISFTKPIVYKTNDPVKGEVYKPFEVIPEVSVKINDKVLIFNTDQPQEIPVIVKAARNNLEGFVQVAAPTHWNVYPKKQSVSIPAKGQEQTVVFTVIPPKSQSEGNLKPIVTIKDKDYSKELIEIQYDHIPHQTVLLPSESRVVRLDIKKRGTHIAYIEGAGDVIPESLKQIGYKVTLLAPENITPETLAGFDAVVVGIRAYNTVQSLQFKQQLLFNFVKNGGTMIVQYNTNRGLVTNRLAPYNLRISRDRVTDEHATVSFIAPEHPVLNEPNKITAQDFEGWTQERGLYFPDKWADQFTPILSMHDQGESPKNGSLLVAKYGKGYYIYTGLSFFREFPAGVAGAYRLFANMLSLGKNAANSKPKLKD